MRPISWDREEALRRKEVLLGQTHKDKVYDFIITFNSAFLLM